jgi:hypothetical protein
MGFEARDPQAPFGSSGVDQLLGSEARPRTQVGEMTLHGARSDAHKVGSVRDRPPSRNVGSKDVNLAHGRSPDGRTAQLPIPHADCPSAAATHSSRPSIGIR